jgi:hypothetical protein
MPPDLTDLLRQAAPTPTRPLDARALVRRARRRTLALPLAAAAVLAAIGTGGALVLTGSSPEDRLEPAPAATTPAAPAEDLGSGACPTVLTEDGSGQPLPVDFEPEVLVVCRSDFRDLPGEGTWEVVVERRTRDRLDEVVSLLRRPYPAPEAEPAAPQAAMRGCLLALPRYPHVLLLAGDGTSVQPGLPREECGGLAPGLDELLGLDAPLTEVAATKIHQVRSEAEVISGCQGYKNMIAVEAPSPSREALAGPVFPLRPDRVQVCVYRQVGDDPTSSSFVRGRWLTDEETDVLVDELGDVDAGPSRCATPSPEFAVISGHGGWVLVELGGCDRVLRHDYTRGQLTAPSTFLSGLG